MLRMYSVSFELEKLSSAIKPFCNLHGDEFKYPSLKDLYEYRVLICTLSTAGCMTRARHDINFQPHHFDYIFIDECASAHETMSLIPIAGNIFRKLKMRIVSMLLFCNFCSILIAGLCTSPRIIHANIVLIGDPKQLDAVTKSDWSIKLGFKTSWFEHLFNLPLYQRNQVTGQFN